MNDLVVAVVGPTATGKSDLGLALAEVLDGEVVNADAMQLYRGMDVGTAKLLPDERRGVPHHQLDVLDVGPHIAHVREGEGHDLGHVGGIGEDLLVAGHGGVEAQLPNRLADMAESLPPDDRAIREHQYARRVRRLRVRRGGSGHGRSVTGLTAMCAKGWAIETPSPRVNHRTWICGGRAYGSADPST